MKTQHTYIIKLVLSQTSEENNINVFKTIYSRNEFFTIDLIK